MGAQGFDSEWKITSRLVNDYFTLKLIKNIIADDYTTDFAVAA